MVRRYWKLLVVIALLGLNAALVISFRKKQEDLKETYLELTKSPVIEYFAYEYSSNSLRYLFRDQSPTRNNDVALAEASDALTKAILAIHQQYNEQRISYQEGDAKDYFSKKTEISQSLQSNLFEAFEKYNTEISHVLEVDIPLKQAFRDSLVESMQRNLNRVENKFKSSAIGSKQNATIDVYMRGTAYGPIAFYVTGVRDKNSIQWEKYTPYTLGYDDYVNYMIMLKQSTHSSNVLQAEKTLAKMNSVFTTRGKVEVYGKVYSLSAITLGELDSVCKYIMMLHRKANADLMVAFEELSVNRFG